MNKNPINYLEKKYVVKFTLNFEPKFTQLRELVLWRKKCLGKSRRGKGQQGGDRSSEEAGADPPEREGDAVSHETWTFRRSTYWHIKVKPNVLLCSPVLKLIKDINIKNRFLSSSDKIRLKGSILRTC